MNIRRTSAAAKLSPPKLSLKKRSSTSPTSTSTVSIKVFLRPVSPDLFVPNLPGEGEPISPGNDLVRMKRGDDSEQSIEFGPSGPSPIIVPCIGGNNQDCKRIGMKSCYSTPNKKPRRKVAQSRGIPCSNFVSAKNEKTTRTKRSKNMCKKTNRILGPRLLKIISRSNTSF